MDFPGGTVDRNLPARQETSVQSLVQEDSTCCGAAKPVYHNYWGPRAAATEAHVPRARALRQEKSPLEKPTHHNEE